MRAACALWRCANATVRSPRRAWRLEAWRLSLAHLAHDHGRVARVGPHDEAALAVLDHLDQLLAPQRVARVVDVVPGKACTRRVGLQEAWKPGCRKRGVAGSLAAVGLQWGCSGVAVGSQGGLAGWGLQCDASHESETTATRPLGYWVSMFLKASSSPGQA